MIVRIRRIGCSLNLAGVTLLFLGAVSAAGIFGCAMGAQGEKLSQTVGGEVQMPRPAPEKAPSPIKETTLQEQPFRIQELSVREEQGQTILSLKFSNLVSQYRHFPLAQPSRVVLDVFGDSKRMARVENFRVNTHWVETLRVSSSEGYLRMVLDVAAATVPAYVIEPEHGGLKVLIGTVVPTATVKREFQLVHDGKRTDVNAAAAKPPSPGVSSPVVAPSGEKRYPGQRISLDFKDADIKNVFRLLAEVSGLNIVVTDEVRKTVTVRLVDVPWDQALDLLIETNNLDKEPVGNVLRISTTTQLRTERESRAAAARAKDAEEPLQDKYLNVNYAKVKDLEAQIKPLLTSRGKIVLDERSNTILVRDIRKSLDDVTTLVSKLDTRTPQVLIESNLIETNPTFSRALGAELDMVWRRAVASSRFLAESPFAGAPNTIAPPFPVPTTGLRYGIALNNLDAFITAAEEEGKIRVISRPSVMTLNNVASTIQSLRILRVQLPTSTNIASGTGAAAGSAVATEKIPVGIILTVTPQVSSDGFVLMNISVKSSSLGTQSPGSIVPDELSREAISNVLVRDGETIVIGGIMKDTSQDAEAGIPYLKNIPGLGWFFKRFRWQKDFEELVVFITPRVVGGGSNNLPTAEQLWRGQLQKTEGG